MQIQSNQILYAAAVGVSIGKNFILAADSYKTTHAKMLPKGTEAFFSYIEARKEDDFTIFAGLQPYLIKFLTVKLTQNDLDEAKIFLDKHIGPGVMQQNYADWEYLIKEYDGQIPVRIRAVKEGTLVPTRNVLCTVECNDGRLAFLASYIETCLQRAIWYPTTVATASFKAKDIIRRMYALTGADTGGLDFALHDFGGRGVTCEEQGQIGASAHLFSFKGTDTMSGVLAANTYYFDEMSAFSVYASEHSIACSYGPEDGEKEYLNVMIDQLAPGVIVSVVADAYDVFKFTEMVTTPEYLRKIIASGGKIVIRPDSGEPVKVLEQIYSILKKNLMSKAVVAEFGNLITFNAKHYMQLPSFLGVLQGDGIDNEMIQRILDMLFRNCWAANNIVFGSGGALLQKHNRDTYKFAQKGSAIKINGVWKEIFKNPITDPGKTSKKGRLTLIKNDKTNEYQTVNFTDSWVCPTGFTEMLEEVYAKGEIKRLQSLTEIRTLVESQV